LETGEEPRFTEAIINLSDIISLAGSAVCVALALSALLRKCGALSWMSFAVGMLLLAADSILAGLALSAPDADRAGRYEELRIQAASFLSLAWLLFSLSHARGNSRDFIRQWRLILLALLGVPLLGFLGSDELVTGVTGSGEGRDLFIGIGRAGRLVSVALLVTSVLVLVNLERTFRSANGIMRWRIKYLLIGVGLLFGARLYTGSQAVLYSGVHGVSLQVTTSATLLAALLIAYSLLRTRLADSEIYVSGNVLQHSIIIFIAGAYLACVGLLANLVRGFGGDASFPVTSLVLMLFIVGLTIVVLSDRLQQRIKIFVSRHFHRPLHDYRKVWSALNERTGALLDTPQLCRAAVKAISDTFELLSVTIWLVREQDHSLVLGASTSLTEQSADQLALQKIETQPLLEGLRKLACPFDIDQSTEAWARPLRDLNPDYFGKGGRRVCVPLISGGEIIGVITVADRVSGAPFSVEDFDLLKCIADQLAGNLRNIQLSQKLVQSRELQAFQTMSAFFVHDLKNTASTLSLMLKNLSAHFGDPEFREDCLASVSRSAAQINSLISRLGLLRHEFELKKVETDLNAVVSAVLAELDLAGGPVTEKNLQPLPTVVADSQQLNKVVTNLLLNAREAVNGSGRITVRTARENGWVVLSVSDNGCGMSPDFVRDCLFKPFQSTKKGGLGIGMFHSKTIIEAHQGRIEIESTPGKGTTFRILLPASS
jgi:putative PEP-CTERM system histidine kinase